MRQQLGRVAGAALHDAQRLEYLDSGLIDVLYLGHKIMVRATQDQVGRRLAEEGVDPDGLVED